MVKIIFSLFVSQLISKYELIFHNSEQAHIFTSLDFWIGAHAYKDSSCQSWVWTNKNQFVTFNEFNDADTCANIGDRCAAVTTASGS